jgi:hypothetical protein
VEDPDGVAMVKRSLQKDLVDTDPEDEVESSSKGAKHKKAKGSTPPKKTPKRMALKILQHFKRNRPGKTFM